jgi:uncharacterized protein (DUF1330 family)
MPTTRTESSITPAIEAPKKAYLWIEATLTDPERFAAYGQKMMTLLPSFGGRYVVFRGAREVLEGEPLGDKRIVVSEWPSLAAARRFWHSPEYAEVRKLREGTGLFRVLLLESLDAGQKP